MVARGHVWGTVRLPERKIRKECDLKAFCTIEGLIDNPDAPEAAGDQLHVAGGG